MMKKVFVSLALMAMMFTGSKVFAQRHLELSGMGGYLLGSYTRYYEGQINFADAATFGGSFGAEVAKNNYFEIDYSLTPTRFEFVPYSTNYEYYKGNVNISYIQLGSSHHFDLGGRVEPFAGGSLGAVIFNPDKNISTVWHFSLALKAGLEIFLTDNVGLKLQARMLMPLYFAGLGFYAGMGTGGASSGLSMNAGAIMLQGDFMGGLVFRFGD